MNDNRNDIRKDSNKDTDSKTNDNNNDSNKQLVTDTYHTYQQNASVQYHVVEKRS